MDSRRLVFILFNQIPYSTRFHSINCIDLSLFQILSFCLHNQLHLFDSLWLQLQIIVSFEALKGIIANLCSSCRSLFRTSKQ